MKGLIIYLFVVVMIVALYGFAYSMDFSHTKGSNSQNSQISKTTSNVSSHQFENF